MANYLFDAFTRAMPPSRSRFMECDDGSELTYGDVLARSARIAHLLVGHGVQPGDRVAVQVAKSAEATMLYLACLRAGAVFLPLNTAYTSAELDYFFQDAEPRLIVCDPASAGQIDLLAARVGADVETLGIDGQGSLSKAASSHPADFANAERGADDLAAILYTSGTTGRSKGAMLSHGNLASNAEVLTREWRFIGSDVLIHALPIFHTHGLFVAVNITLMAGASMIFQQRFDPDAVMAAMPRATVMMGVPTFYVRLLQHHGLSPATTAHMRLFISGSAPLLAETHAKWKEITGHAILERYGMTETNMNTSNPYDGERRPGTVGFPLPGVELRITDPETGQYVPQGGIGMIEVKGPNVFSGYWRMPEKTHAELRDNGFFITGDLGLIDADGYVHIVGRGKDLIISGGYNIYPKEVESEIDALPGVVESAVFGLPHRDFGEAVTAAVILENGANPDDAAIISAISGRLARFKHPKKVIFLAELPRNTMGKVQKNLLRDAYAGLYE